MCKQPKQWKTIATIFIMQCASWPEAMAEACEDTCHRCRISWMQRTFWKCGMDTKFCHTPVPDSVPVTKLSTVFFENIYHRHKPTSFRLTGKVIYPVLPWAACAYDGLAGFLFKHLLMIFEKKTWNMEFFGNESCKSWIDLLVFMSTTSATARAHFTTPEVLPALAVHGCVQHLLFFGVRI